MSESSEDSTGSSAPSRVLKSNLRRALVLGVGSGLAEFLSHPGIGWPALAVVFVGLQLSIARTCSVRNALAAFWTTGTVAWGLSLAWLPEGLASFSGASLLVSSGVLFLIVQTQTIPYIFSGLACWTLGGYAALQVTVYCLALSACETLSVWPLPYSHAVLWLDLPGGAKVINLLGRDCASAVLLLASALAVQLGRLTARRKSPYFQTIPPSFLAAPAGSIGIAVFIGWVSRGALAPVARPLRLGLLQSDLPLDAKRIRPEEVLDWHLRESKRFAVLNKVDALIWGEVSMAQKYSQEGHAAVVLRHSLPPVLAGASVREGGCQSCSIHNSVLLINGSAQRYDKQRLVPFAEYVPQWFRLNDHTATTVGSFAPSTRNDLFEISGVRVASPVCYEAMFPSIMRDFADRGARVAVNLANDRWLGSSMGRRAHEQLVRLSALDAGLSLVRLVDSGPSKVWDSNGNLTSALPAGRAIVATVEVK